jgi:flagellar basal-body rod protein FlgB
MPLAKAQRMLPGLFQSTTIPALDQLAQFTHARHAVLAGNVANIDTPGYRSRDLSVDEFQSKLRDLLVSSRESGSGESSELDGLTAHVTKLAGGGDQGDALSKVRDSMHQILYHDDSDKNMEHQVAEINKNQMMHNLAVTLMSSQFRLLQMAISERV